MMADGSRVQIKLRASSDLHLMLSLAAKQNGHSLNQEIERILEAHFAAAEIRVVVREEVRAALSEVATGTKQKSAFEQRWLDAVNRAGEDGLVRGRVVNGQFVADKPNA